MLENHLKKVKIYWNRKVKTRERATTERSEGRMTQQGSSLISPHLLPLILSAADQRPK
jgi:hypothetical protein